MLEVQAVINEIFVANADAFKLVGKETKSIVTENIANHKPKEPE